MNRQHLVMNTRRGYWRQIEKIYQVMIARYRGNPEWLAWAKAWRLEKLRAVCQKVKD